MQQLKVDHKKIITTDQKVVENTTTKKDRRPGTGLTVALSRRIYRLQNTDMFYVESETRDDHYYFVKFKPDVFDEWCCSCKDNSTRHIKCKHLFAIEFAIKWGTVKDIDEVPSLLTTTSPNNELGQSNNNTNINTNKTIKIVAPPSIISKSPSSYKDDDYSF
jgi:hypothetical protein